MSGVQYVLGNCWLIFSGQCLLPSPYTSYEALLAPGATKDAHWLLSLGLANHPTWGIQQKEPRPWRELSQISPNPRHHHLLHTKVQIPVSEWGR